MAKKPACGFSSKWYFEPLFSLREELVEECRASALGDSDQSVWSFSRSVLASRLSFAKSELEMSSRNSAGLT